jgi:large subunit ribosomal protein L6
VSQEDGSIVVTPEGGERTDRMMQGLTRALIANMVPGVSVGFQQVLEIIGVGYRANVDGKNLVLELGYSHPIRYAIPEGIEIQVEKNTLVTVRGIDKQKVGDVAADIRGFRPPEPYKGKGVRYQNEYVRRKEGKKNA